MLAGVAVFCLHMPAVIGTALGVVIALVGGFAVYGLLKTSLGIRLSQEEEYNGADLSIHKIGAVSQD